MDRQALKDLLDAEGVSPRAYRLDGRLQDDALTLEVQSVGAVVFYSERGLRGKEWTFGSEADACEFLAGELLADEHNRFELVAGPASGSRGAELLAGWLAEHELTAADVPAHAVKQDDIPWRQGVWARRVFVRRAFLRERGLLRD